MSSKLKKLGALADIYQAEHLDGTITKIRLTKIHPSDEQPRRDRMTGIDELAASIEKDGLLSPILVTRDGEGYRIIAGERRYHAIKKLGKQDAECKIISREERDYWRISIIENLQRENLSPGEEAVALLKLKKQENYSDHELSSIVGKSRSYITEILGIAGLPRDILNECQKIGIDNKNFLIQVVQAHKHGRETEFLQACRSGRVKTVQAAKEFNQIKKRQQSKPQNNDGSNKIAKKQSPPFKLKRVERVIQIECLSEKNARHLENWILKSYR